MRKIYNFSAGPAILPHEVLQQAQAELLDWSGTGASVMELSHRDKEFDECAIQATEDLKTLLNIPDNYRILFCQGGARAQFALLPMNLLGNKTQADYIDSGYWSQCAIEEAKKYCQVNHQKIRTENAGKIALKPMSDWQLSDDSAYLHYCPNETIDGVAIHQDPIWNNTVVAADLSSNILSKPIDVSRYGVIYAGAQKNIGPSGITIVIVREDLLGKAHPLTPSVFDYQVLAKNNSMFNTPPTFAWYMSGLVFKWLLNLGGLTAIEQRNQLKAQRLYNAIDQSDFYQNSVDASCRSIMNVPFTLQDESLDKLFISEAKKEGIIGIKGHRIVGGMRASIYNAMDINGVDALVAFMREFERNKG